MKTTYSKNYFEKYAALTLEKIFHISANSIIQDDCPDLRIENLHWGIEVTQALLPEEAIADKKKPLYQLLNMNPFDHSDDELSFVLYKIKDALHRKEKKSRHYVSYQHNGLYIFSHCHNIQQNDLHDFLMNYSFETDFYDVIFINCVSCVYQYTITTQAMIKFSYPLKDLQMMNQMSLDFEKHCHKQRRKIDI